VAALLKKTKHPWVLTYGNHEEIRQLYDWAKIETIHMESSFTKKYRTDLIITPAKRDGGVSEWVNGLPSSNI
jgi:tRNA G37 N-methylase TrmD